MSLRHIIRRLGVPKSLEFAAIAAMIYHAVFIAGVVAVKSGSNALFLGHHRAETLPALYIGTAAAIAVGSFALAQPLARYSAYTVGKVANRVAAVALIVLALLVWLDAPGALPLLYIAGETYTTLLSILFWGTMSEIFDLRTSKRVMGVVGAAGMAGSVIAGTAVAHSASFVDPIVQIVAAGALLLAATPIFARIGRSQERTMIPKHTGGQARVAAGLHYARAERYPKLLGALVVLLSLLSALVDFLFRSAAAAAETVAGMNEMFANYNADAGVIALVFQLFLSSYLLQHMGLFRFLLLIPLSTAVVAVWAIQSSDMGTPLYALKVVQSVGSFSVTAAAVALLYNPIPTAVRGSLRALLDGTVKKLGAAGAGLLLLILGLAAPWSIHPALVLVVVVGVIAVVVVLRRDYAGSLNRKITGRVRNTSAQPLLDTVSVDDASTRRILEGMLRAENPSQVRGAFRLLDEAGAELGPFLAGLLNHRDESVRLLAIEWACEHPTAVMWNLLESMVNEGHERRSRAAAGRALSAIDPARAAPLMRAALTDAKADPGFRAAAIEALFAVPDQRPEAERIVLGAGRQMAEADNATRREFARLLGNLPPGKWSEILIDLLRDEEVSVVRLAAASAGKLRLPSLIEPLAQLLTDRHVRLQVRSALAAFGDQLTGPASDWLNDPTLSLRMRQEVPRLLRMIGSPAAADALLHSRQGEDPFIQYRIAIALSRIVHQRPAILEQLDKARIHQAILHQIRRLFVLRQQDLALLTSERFEMLQRAVASRHAQVLDICLRLFGLDGDRQLIHDVTRVLVSGNRASRGDALELLDVSLHHHPLRGALLAELERSEETIEPGRAEVVAATIAKGTDRTLAAVAGRSLNLSGFPRPTPDTSILPEDLMSDELIDRIVLLQRVDLFSDLNIDELAAVADLARQERYAPGQAIYRENDPGTALYIVVSGDVSFHRDGNFLLRLGSFQSFGQVSFLDRKPRPASATASRRGDGVEVLVVYRQDFMDLVADRIEVLNGLFTVLTKRLREVVEGAAEHNSIAVGNTAVLPAVKLT
jgi:HEAT repeat protein